MEFTSGALSAGFSFLRVVVRTVREKKKRGVGNQKNYTAAADCRQTQASKML